MGHMKPEKRALLATVIAPFLKGTEADLPKRIESIMQAIDALDKGKEPFSLAVNAPVKEFKGRGQKPVTLERSYENVFTSYSDGIGIRSLQRNIVETLGVERVPVVRSASVDENGEPIPAGLTKWGLVALALFLGYGIPSERLKEPRETNPLALALANVQVNGDFVNFSFRVRTEKVRPTLVD